MSFIWNVEEQKLKKEKDSNKNLQIFSAERLLSRDEKIAFIDSRTNGQMTELLELYDKFQAEKDTIKKNVDGGFKDNSLKAWMAKNIETLRWSDYKFEIWGIGCDRRLNGLMYKGPYQTYDDVVDQAFHDMLWDLYHEEIDWFKAHDESSILKKKLEESKTFPLLGFSYWTGSGGLQKDVNGKPTQYTIEELRYLSAVCDKLEKKLDETTAKIRAEFENKFPD